MKRIFFFLFTLILLPSFVFADCSNNGYTVVYVNGIFTSEIEAINDKDLLRRQFVKKFNNSDIFFINGYNPSHLIGGGDIAKAILQAYGVSGLDTDLIKILQQVHSELSTRKVLLVGHSQGTFYTNLAYDYLVANGVPRESIAVYNIATPADRVAGNGGYLTSSTDKVINAVVRDLANKSSAKKPLPANIFLPLSPKEEQDKYGGHSLSAVYLAGAPDRIIGEMKRKIDGLSASDNAQECFIEPKKNVAQKFGGLALAFGDKTTSLIVGAGSTIKNTTLAITDSIFYFMQDMVYRIAEAVKNPNIFIAGLGAQKTSDAPVLTDVGRPEYSEADNAEKIDVRRLSPIDVGHLFDKQDEIDDLLEKIDLLRRQLADLEALENKEKLAQTDAKTELLIENNENQTTEIVTTSAVYNSTGSRTPYPKLAISEVQTAGIADSKEEFVELYNPNPQDVDLTNWYLQKKTKTGTDYATFVPNTLFAGRKIPAKGYFLIARQNYFNFSGDLWIENPLTDDNSLALKNPGGEIVDKVGFGLAQDFENLPTINPGAGQSIGRKLIGQDTDNNLMDFQLNVPTPKTNNIIYVAPKKEEPKDALAPEVVFTLDALQKSLFFPVNFSITDTAKDVTPSGIAGYTFRWKEETPSTSSGQAGDWQEDGYKNISDKSAIFSGVREFTGNDETNYYFQIKTKDLAGNESDWQPEIPAPTKVSLFKKVLINEIQIDSTDGVGGTNDDFIEFYNPNDVDILLGGWSLQKFGSDDPCSLNKSYYKKNFENNAKISAKGYFLFANSSASDSLKGLADMTASFSLSDNNTVYLVTSQDKIVDASNASIVDKVGFGEESCFFETSPASAVPDGKSIERKKLGQDTDDNSQDFKISDEVSPGSGFPKTIIQDATNYTLLGAPVGNLLITWQSPSPDVYFDIQSKLGAGDWKSWLTKTSQTQESFIAPYSLLNDKVYSFRARVQDQDGNTGDWSDEIVVDLANPILINEVAYGTDASSSDQWIELYNRSDKDIDLTDFSIISGNGFGFNAQDTLNIPLQGTILAKDYFILERGDDDVLSDVLADQLFGESIGKNYLYLRTPNGRYVDGFYVPEPEISEGIFIKDGKHFSMERVSAVSFGSSDRNWKLARVDSAGAKDREDGKIYGTPGQKNSVDGLYTYYNSGFMEDTVLKKDFSPYLFFGQNVVVGKGFTLTVEPGTVLKFYDRVSKLEVRGTLNAVGTSESPIVFTSFKDDSDGKDSNGDGSAVLPIPGDWLSLYFSPESQNSQLENVRISFAGAVMGFSPLGWGNAVWADGAGISLKNSVLENNRNRALVLTNSNSVVESVQFLNNNITDWPFEGQSMGVWVQGASPEIKNSHFENNVYGILVSAFYDPIAKVTIPARPIIENNNFVKSKYPIILDSLSGASFSGNKATENIFNAIILPSAIYENATLKPDLPYLVQNILVVRENITLTLNPGVNIDFLDNRSGLQIDGTLKAVGTPDLPIAFRPRSYDKPNILPSAFLGLRFTKTSLASELENVVISYGGSLQDGNYGSAIKVEESAISLKNSALQKNANRGVWLINSPSIIDNVQFLEQNTANSGSAKAVHILGNASEIKNSFFKKNYYGIYIENWKNPVTSEDVVGAPILEKNKFEENTIDIFPIPAEPEPEPSGPEPDSDPEPEGDGE